MQKACNMNLLFVIILGINLLPVNHRNCKKVPIRRYVVHIYIGMRPRTRTTQKKKRRLRGQLEPLDSSFTASYKGEYVNIKLKVQTRWPCCPGRLTSFNSSIVRFLWWMTSSRNCYAVWKGLRTKALIYLSVIVCYFIITLDVWC
jgi:hypothetical protein